jgi:predicted nucleotidyltransferase
MDLKFLLEKLFNKNVDLIIEKSLKPRLKYVKKETIYLKRL